MIRDRIATVETTKCDDPKTGSWHVNCQHSSFTHFTSKWNNNCNIRTAL